MTSLRNIIFIPQWIVENLQRNQENLSTVLDLTRMRQFTSLDDLVSLVALNNSIGTILGTNIHLSIGSGLSHYWQMHSNEDTKFFIANSIYPNIQPESGNNAIHRLLSENEYETQVDLTFDTIDLGHDVSAIVLKYGFFDSNRRDDMEYQLIEAILQILYVYHPHHIVADTEVGRRYLELLSHYQN